MVVRSCYCIWYFMNFTSFGKILPDIVHFSAISDIISKNFSKYAVLGKEYSHMIRMKLWTIAHSAEHNKKDSSMSFKEKQLTHSTRRHSYFILKYVSWSSILPIVRTWVTQTLHSAVNCDPLGRAGNEWKRSFYNKISSANQIITDKGSWY